VTASSDAFSPATDQTRLHRAGSAWTDCGTAHLVSGGPGDWAASVNCYRRAVEVLGELPIAENTDYLADLGAAWVNLGCALQAGTSMESLGEAMDAFDRGVDLLGRLPFEANPRFRHNLAAAWMNRADAFARIDTATSREGALQAYGRAIEIAGELPLDEKPSFRVLLASCWINKGNLEQRLPDFSGAIRSYDGALAAIGGLPRSGHRLACHHAATAWTNRGEALLSASPGEGAMQAVESATMALAQLERRDLGGSAEAKLSLRALRVMARGLEAQLRSAATQDTDGICALTDITERGMNLAFRYRGAAPDVFDPFILWFFSFGSRAYGRYQPQFLVEYLEEALRRLDLHACRGLEPDFRAFARQAAAGALEGLSLDRVLVAGTRQTELLMRTVREIRGAVAQLDS
jgi:tetratricopeptide (TPR) repeat protein